MTFVYPLLLGGLILAGLPVVLHFLARKKPRTVLFPAYRFLVQKKKSNTRNLRLRHLLLLLMRIALIVLLCVALARPRVQNESFGLLDHEKPAALVLVFDTTPSMAYRSGEQTRLDLAKLRAQEFLDQLPDDCRVLVLDVADPVGNARAEWHRSLEPARKRIQSLAIRPESVPATQAMDEAYRRFEAWDDPDAYRLPRFVCVFSDRTRASWQSNAGIQRPANVQALYFDVGINEPVDVAITAADVDRQTYLAGDKFPLKVTVRATGSKTSSAINVKVGNQTVTQIVNVEAGSHGTFELEIDSANIKAGLHQAEVSLETDDSWPGNNRRYVTFRIVDKPRILVLCEDRSRTELLARALRSLNYTVEESTITDSPDLRKFDAVFLAGVAAPPEMLWLDLANYVQEGRGVCIIPPGEEMDRASYNNEAAQKVMPGPVLKQVESKGAAWNFTDLDHLQHPFMTFYRRWLDFDVVLKPGLTYRYWQVPRQGVLVEYDDANRDPAVIERVGGKKSGRVLLLTTPLDVRDPAWINYTDRLMAAHYLALVKSCANYLCTPPESLPLNFQFGQEAAPSFTLGSQAFPKYELAGEGFSEEIRFDEKGRWSAERLSAPGNYSVLGINPETSDKTVLHRFSINISGAESDLTRVPIDEIESALGKNAVSAQDRRHSIADTLDWEEPLELFPWLMIALLFLLAFENLLANRFYRKEPLE